MEDRLALLKDGWLSEKGRLGKLITVAKGKSKGGEGSYYYIGKRIKQQGRTDYLSNTTR